MGPSPYRYRPLQTPSTIRLLKILPELKDGKIACTLEHFQDDAVPPYHTLSYVWGDPKKTRQIRIKDADADSWHEHGLHESLWEFLDQMHTLHSHHNDHYLWTDFLCLDQGSTTEVNQQVPRMGKIYSGAARTIAWLGRPSRAARIIAWLGLSSRAARTVAWLGRPSQAARIIAWLGLSSLAARTAAWLGLSNLAARMMAWLDRLSSTSSLPHELDWIPDWLTLKRQRAEELPPFILPQRSKWWTFTDSTAWVPALWSSRLNFNRNLKSKDVLPLGSWYIPFHKILCLPYWKRAWIVQEIALSQKVDLVFGTKSIDIDDFLLAYKVHMHHMSRGLRPEEQLIAADAARRTPRNELSIFKILEWAELCISTNRLDRVYGLLGLMEAHESEESPMPMLQVNYEKDVVELYWDVVFACCRSSPLIPGAISIIMDRVQKLLQCSITLETLKAYAENKRTSNINIATAKIALGLAPAFRALSPFDGIHVCVAPSAPVPSSWELSTMEAGPDHVFYHPQQAEYGSFLKLAIMFLLRGNGNVPAQTIQAAVVAALLAPKATDQGQWVCEAHLSPVHKWVRQAHLNTVDPITSANETNRIHFKVLRGSVLWHDSPSNYIQVPPMCSQASETPCDNSLLVLNIKEFRCNLSFSPSEEKQNLGDLVVFDLSRCDAARDELLELPVN